MKFPRTTHAPFSPGFTPDDLRASTMASLQGQPVITSYKYDGENSTLRRDKFHARSLDSRHHPSRDWLKAFHGSIAYQIPEGWRICGENLYARHSLAYDDLLSYFYGFHVWDDTNTCLDWDTTLMWFEELEIVPVEVVMSGIFDDNYYKALVKLAESLDTTKHEGLVTRFAGGIPYDRYGELVFKWVRPNHVITDEHWMHAEIVPNKLRVK